MSLQLPDGLISIEELGTLAEYDDLELDENQSKLADMIIRMTGVIIRGRAGKVEWSAAEMPYEVKVLALDFARRVFNNPQNQTRITTGPLGESYAPDEVVGLQLKPHEVDLLESYGDSDGSLSVVRIERSDPLTVDRRNYDLAAVKGLGLGDEFIRLPSLTKYLGIDYSG